MASEIQDRPLEDRIAELGPWFHNLRIHGIQTAPQHDLGDYPTVKWDSFKCALPADLCGMTVLDIGCNAGFYCMEMKRRGAARVLGIDHDEHYLRQARFAAEISQMQIEYRRLTVWDIATLHEKFDLVIFMGVLYHLRHPLLALDLIHEHAARDLLLFQSMQRGSRQVPRLKNDYPFSVDRVFLQSGFPAAYFIEHQYCGDPTNWWIPNRACTEAMLRSAGFSISDHLEQEVYLCHWQPHPYLTDGSNSVYPARE